MKKIDEILNYINKKASANIDSDFLSMGATASEIEKELGIVRNNASTLLNNLFKSNFLIKIKTRPVTYISAEIFKTVLKVKKIKYEYSINEIKEIENMIKQEYEDPFENLIGYKGSLENQIEQAKAAIMYPPYGLHILILGESGVGKTTFAKLIYKYAKIKKNKTENKFPFVSFNCSDYFNNPQLLMAHLFGYVKGAFTGAEKDKEGVIEKADGGILFLDEVHRLPSDGQEMLFYLMDKGEFMRLGETSSYRKANVVIIAATTEKPTDVLLTTFLRRIPVIINLPPFREKSIGEKIEVIEYGFQAESKKLNKKLSISPEVIKTLALQDTKGNIGEINSIIKITCAEALMKYKENEDKISIDYFMLPKSIKVSSINMKSIDNKTRQYLNIFENNIEISPDSYYKGLNYLDNSYYDKLIDEISNVKNDKEEVANKFDDIISSYYNDIIKNNKFDYWDTKKLYNVVDKNIVNLCRDFINAVSMRLGLNYSDKLFWGLSFHVKAMVDRIKEGKIIHNDNLEEIKETNKVEFNLTEKFAGKLEKIYNINISEDEIAFIVLLIINSVDKRENTDKPGILLICHGESTATSMAQVCNSLFNTNLVKAIDMPLDSKVEDTYNKVLASVIAMDRGNGIILLVDMGSLIFLGDRIQKQTGIKVKTVQNITTLDVLNILRFVLYNDVNIENILEDGTKSYRVISKKKAILTVCTTGIGVAKMAEEMINNLLKENNIRGVEVITSNYDEIREGTEKRNRLMKEYELICSIGDIEPDFDCPYFNISQLVINETKEKIIKLINIHINQNERLDEEKFNNSNIFETSVRLLEKNVVFINPKIAVEKIKEFIDNIGLKYGEENSEEMINLILHLGCMLDRLIRGIKIIYKNKGKFIEENKKIYTLSKKNFALLEKFFNITISDDEICYFIKIILHMVNIKKICSKTELTESSK